MRCDMICTNINKYINICENRYENDKMIYLCYLKHDEGYLLDYAHFGSIDDTLKYVHHYQDNNDNRYAEKFRQQSCYGTSDYNFIKDKAIFVMEEAINSNIEFCYIKDGYKHYKTNLKDYFGINNKQ
jgi:hypothetical protein